MAPLSDHEPQGPRHKLSHPTGWEPSLEWSPGEGGTISTGPLEHEPTDAIWREIVGDWGLNPKDVRIISGSVQIRAWDAQTADGVQRLRYYRARIEPVHRVDDAPDVAALCRMIERRKPRPVQTTGTGRSIVANCSDWQTGKGEGGGTEAMVERVLEARDGLVAKVKRHRRDGTGPDQAVLVGLGDLVEGCSEHYAAQTYTVDLDRREQARLVRRLLLSYVDALTDLGLPIILAAVPGNHGENRRGGKAYTNMATDNDDLAVFEQLGEILAANPDRYGNVKIPLGAIAEDMTVTLDVSGVACSWAHGHQITRGGPEQWWKGQALGRQPVADASILFLGHKHHLWISESTGRTIMQMPAMDGGSAWWTAQTGQSSPAGMVAVMVGQSCGPRGWSDLAIL